MAAQLFLEIVGKLTSELTSSRNYEISLKFSKLFLMNHEMMSQQCIKRFVPIKNTPLPN